MPRRKWRLKDRRQPLSPAVVAYLEVGLGALLAMPKRSRPDDWQETLFFRTTGDLAAAWEDYGEEITAAWAAEHAGTRPWGWWMFAGTAPRACVEGAEYVWKPGVGDWVWKQEFGLPGRPQARKPGAPPARLVFESQAGYLQRLTLLAPDEAQQLGPEDFEPEIVEIPELPDALFGPRPVPPRAVSMNGVHRNGAA